MYCSSWDDQNRIPSTGYTSGRCTSNILAIVTFRPKLHYFEIVMCRLGLEALSRPEPALESRAEPEPCRWL